MARSLRGFPRRGAYGLVDLLMLAERAHQINRIFRMAVLVQARSRRSIQPRPGRHRHLGKGRVSARPGSGG
jgi:hypothetical protein